MVVPRKVLNLGYLQPLAKLKLHAYFPSVGPDDETGAKRGSVVLCREDRVAALLDGVGSLVRSDQLIKQRIAK